MIIASASQFHVYLPRGQRLFSIVKVQVGPFNQEKVLVGVFSVIVKTNCETDGSSAALVNVDLVQLHELPDAVEHVVVLGGGARHLLDDGGHVAEDRGVQQGWEHHSD